MIATYSAPDGPVTIVVSSVSGVTGVVPSKTPASELNRQQRRMLRKFGVDSLEDLTEQQRCVVEKHATSVRTRAELERELRRGRRK